MGVTSVSAILGPRDYGDRMVVGDSIGHALRLLTPTHSVVRIGDRVVLKPNWVKENDERRPGPRDPISGNTSLPIRRSESPAR